MSKRLVILTLMMALLIPAAGLACNDKVVFTSASKESTMVPLYSEPSEDAEVLFNFFSGVGLDVLGHEGDYMAVRLKNAPGFSGVSATYRLEFEDDEVHPIGYLSQKDVCEIQWRALDTYYSLLPSADIIMQDDDVFRLLSTPSEDATTIAVMMPGMAYRLLGEVNGYALLCSADGILGYTSVGEIQSDRKSSGLPFDLLSNPQAIYQETMPLRFATVDLTNEEEKVPLYQEASKKSASHGEYACGTVVQVLSQKGDFCHVRTADGEGYMQRSLLRMEGDKGSKLLTTIDNYRCSITGETVALYDFPDENANLMGDIDGIDVRVLGIAGSWYYVEPESWYEDYAFRGFMRPDDRAGQGMALSREETYAIVVLPEDEDVVRIPLLKEPSKNAKVLNTYYGCTQVLLLAGPVEEEDELASVREIHYAEDYDDEDGFYHVRVDGMEGYMPAQYMQVIEKSNPSSW